MSCGIIKGDRLTWTGGCGRSRSYHAEFPTWLLGQAGRSAERDGVFSDKKEDRLFFYFLISTPWLKCWEGLYFFSFNVSEQHKK